MGEALSVCASDRDKDDDEYHPIHKPLITPGRTPRSVANVTPRGKAVPRAFAKLSVDVEGWRKNLGECMESPVVSAIIIFLILVDLGGTAVNDVLENTDLLNPKYSETGETLAKLTHNTCVSVLSIFFVEQLLHIVAFGAAFFSKIWMVMDLIVVTLSLLCETVLEDTFSGVVPLLIVLRLWKLCAFIFDCLLAHTENAERDAKENGKKPMSALAPHKKLSKATTKTGCRKQLGELLESPAVSGLVIILIFVDLGCTAVNDTLENTDILNPKYDAAGERIAKLTHNICVSVLCVFFTEQLLHLIAFGCDFFSKFWMVMDLIVVSVSLVCETTLEDTFSTVAPLMVILRLWKLAAFIFDCCLADDEADERDEAECQEEGTFTRPFTPGAVGLDLFVKDGIIRDISDWGQAHENGVKPGMQIVAINGKPFSDALLTRYAGGDYPYQITFKHLSREELTTKGVPELAEPSCFSAFTKLSKADGVTGWRKHLGESMEHPVVSLVVICLIFVDLGGTAINDALENTDLLNPAYSEQGEAMATLTHQICVTVLYIFLAEQLLHIVAFGKAFFGKIWMVMDLLVVSMSLLCETVLEDTFSGVVPLLIVLRLWKVGAFIFDCLLAHTESVEKDEAENAEAGTKRKKSSFAPHKKLSKETEVTGCRKSLGEFLESPVVSAIVICLIFVDLGCTAVNDTLENTNLLNPKYKEESEYIAELTHNMCVGVLCVFFTEQLLHLIAFGCDFFTKFWMVMDLIVVSVSLLCETILEDTFSDIMPLLLILRLWKLAAFVFDCFLAEDETDEKDEKENEEKKSEKAKARYTNGQEPPVKEQSRKVSKVPKLTLPGDRDSITDDEDLGRKLAVVSWEGRETTSRRPQKMLHAFEKVSASIDVSGWRKNLGESLESPAVSGVVIVLIFVDLFGTAVNDVLENTKILNPKYSEQGEYIATMTHNVCVSVLCIFFLEQMLHLVAFGAAFFSKIWMVMDLVVVTLSLLCETVLEDTFSGVVPLLIVLRLWKLGAFVFDCLLAHTESAERDEKEYGKKRRSALLPHAKLSQASAKKGCKKSLGEVMESPQVSAIVIGLIFVDLACTAINDLLENTDLLNPAYHEEGEKLAELTHNICLSVLSIFLFEQVLHLIAFGCDFFTKIWMVLDLIVVSLSLMCETVLEDAFATVMPLMVVLRLWKVVAFIFDCFLADDEADEKDEKEYSMP